jgi:CHAT domain-containing protein
MPTRDVRPPDLEMRVRTVAENGRTRLSFTLHSPTGAVDLTHREIAGHAFQGSPEDFQTRLLHKLEHLAQRLDVDGSCLIAAELDRKLAGLGHDLWRELIPVEIRYAYREIRRSVRSWMIVSDEPWIPWELIKPYDDSVPEDVIDDDFLALQFELTRWLAGDKSPSRQINVRQLAAFRTAVNLSHADQERNLLRDMVRWHPDLLDATPAVSSAGAVLTFLESRSLDLLHFIGHGTHTAGQPEESGIPFPDGSVLRPVDLDGPLATRIGRSRPLVFLNACWAGQQGWSLTRLGGWAARWVAVCGCGGFVAPMWPVRDKTALAFAEAFYGALAGGATLGQASLAARRHVVQVRPGDPSTLAYTVYGHPNARLSFGEEAEVAPDSVAAPAAAGFRVPVLALDAPRSHPKSGNRPWRSPRAPRLWAAVALGGALLVIPAAMGGRFAELADWRGSRQEASAPATETAKKPTGTREGSPAEPAPDAQQDRERKPVSGPAAPPPKPSLSTMIPFRTTTSGSGEGTTFEITAASGVPRATLDTALQTAASPLAEMGVKGWTLHIDVDAPQITPHTQDGFPWQACRLTARCRARRQGESLDLGSVPAVISKVDRATACEAAAKALGEAVINRFATLWRERYENH